MINITHAAASAAILRHADEGRLVQGQWHTEKNGRDLACLLGAIHPNITSPADCGADLMPAWLAELTVVLFDGLPKSEMLHAARRYGELVARWHVLSPAQWDAVLTQFLIYAIDQAVDAVRPAAAGKSYWLSVEAACEQAKSALQNNGN